MLFASSDDPTVLAALLQVTAEELLLDAQIEGVSLAQDSAASFDRLHSLYVANQSVAGFDAFVRSGERATAKILQGFAAELWRLGSAQEQELQTTPQNASALYSLVRDASIITGISAKEFLHVISGRPENFAQRLHNLFELHGLSPLYQRSGGQANTYAVPAVRQDGTLRIYYDLPFGATVQSVHIHAVTSTGLAASGIQASSSRLFADIPLSAIPQDPAGIRFQVTVQTANGTQSNLTQWITVDSLPSQGKVQVGSFQIDAKAIASYSAEEQERLREVLDMGDLSEIPETNHQILQYIIDKYIATGEFQYNSSAGEWIGNTITDNPDISGDNDWYGECKYWLQMDIVSQFDPSKELPANKNGILYEWNMDADSDPRAENVEAKFSSAAELDMEDAISDNLVKEGDIIQIAGGTFGVLHTMVIGKIEDDGIWVFDSNFVETKTPGYHKVSYSSINAADGFTVYRVL